MHVSRFWLKSINLPMPSISSSLSVVYSLLGLLFGYTIWPRAHSPVVCRCDRDAEDPVLSILQKQLDRCGPEQLRIPSCPDCKIEYSSFARTLELFLVAVLSGAAGWLASCGYYRCVYSRRAPRLPLSAFWESTPKSLISEEVLHQSSGDDSPNLRPLASLENGSRWTPSQGSGVRRIRRPG